MRKLLWFTVGFASACFVCTYLYCEYLLAFMLVALVLGAAGCIAVRFWKHFRIFAAVFLGLGIGFGGFVLYDNIYLQPVRQLDGQICHVQITVSEYGVDTDYGCGAEGTAVYQGMTYRVRFYLNEKTELAPGDVVSGEFRMNFTADGGDDTLPQYQGEGIFLTAVQKGSASKTSQTQRSLLHYPAIWRRQLLQKLDEAFPTDVAAVAKGLLLGDKADLDYETETAFKISGISHIVAVSGLHISILFGLVSILTLRRRWLTALICIPILIIFAAVVGFTPSVTRACIMYILMLLSWLLLRQYDPPTELAFSVLVMLAANPLAITSVSLQLSTACMAGFFMFSGKLRNWMLDPKRLGGRKGAKGRVIAWIVSSISVTLGATVFTIPLCAYYFGTVSLVSLVTNLLTLWAVSLVFYGIVLVCVLGFAVPALAGVCGWLLAWPIRYVLLIAKGIAKIPFAAVYTSSPYVVIWLLVAYGLLGAYLLTKKKRPVLFASAIIGSLALAVVAGWLVPKFDDYRITVLDVGNGQCILLQTDGKTYMVDCGGDYDKGVANDAAQLLLTQGITKLDGLILTHFDEDHIGGAKYLLTRVDARQIYVPNIDDEKNVVQEIAAHTQGNVVTVTEKTIFAMGESELTIFPADSRKESGLCILLQTQKCDILITGDLDTDGESRFVRHYALPDIEILVAGHHGSADSTTEALLNAVKPEYAVISVGKDNFYGHPTQAVLDRLTAHGCRIYRTDHSGTIIFRG